MLWVEKAGSAELYFQTIEMVWCLCSHNLRKVNQPTFFKNAEMLWLLAGYGDAFFWMRAYTGRWKNDENCIYLSVLTVLTLRYPWKLCVRLNIYTLYSWSSLGANFIQWLEAIMSPIALSHFILMLFWLSCWLVVDFSWFTFINVRLLLTPGGLMLIRVKSCWVRAGFCSLLCD